MDRDRVIRGIECCTRTGREQKAGGCDRCPYHDGPECLEQLLSEAMECLVDDALGEDDGK